MESTEELIPLFNSLGEDAINGLINDIYNNRDKIQEYIASDHSSADDILRKNIISQGLGIYYDGLTDNTPFKQQVDQIIIDRVSEIWDGSKDTFKKALDTAVAEFRDNPNAIISQAKANAPSESLEHHVPLNVNADDLSNYKGQTEDLMQEIEEMADFIQDNVNKGVLKELDKHLIDCRSETEKFAYSVIRFDDALQDMTENYDD